MKNSYKTYMRSVGRKPAPPEAKLRSSHSAKPGDVVMRCASRPWWRKSDEN